MSSRLFAELLKVLPDILERATRCHELAAETSDLRRRCTALTEGSLTDRKEAADHLLEIFKRLEPCLTVEERTRMLETVRELMLENCGFLGAMTRD